MTSPPTPMPWIKLYTKILDDPKLGRLPDVTKWRFVQLCHLESRIACEGDFICSIGHIAKEMGIRADELEPLFRELTESHIMKHVEIYWTRESGYEDWIVFWEFAPYIRRYFKVGFSRNNHGWQRLRGIVLERDKHRCQYCGDQATHVDHIIPVCQGGSDDLDNLIAACANCNLRKGGRTPSQAGMEVLNACLV